MKLTVVGCSPGWANAGGAHSGYLVEGPGRLLLDCGGGVLAKLRTGSDWPIVDAIAITHLDVDHWIDLIPWAWGMLYGAGVRTEPPQLLLPPGGGDRLDRLCLELTGVPELPGSVFRVQEYTHAVAREVAGFELLPLEMPHHGKQAYGFRVTDGAAVLAYSGDTGPHDGLAELARDCDLFLCDATLARPEPEPRGHLTAPEAVAAFAASGGRRLVLTHRPDERPLDVDAELAHDGLEMEL